MSIQTEIDRLKTNVSDSYAAVADKGGTVPEQAVSDNLAAAVRTIPAGGSSEEIIATLVRSPVGTIVIWSGTADNIPAGWQLCDGTNGTPDLRDKFVLGAGETHPVGETGGEEEVTLTEAQMPKHTHTVRCHYDLDNPNGIQNNLYASFIGVHQNVTYASFNLSELVGSSKPHPNMPPYYALCYIMKLTADATDGVTQEELDTALAGKQDKLTGAAGQVVGFDADGNPVPQGTGSLVGPPGPQGPAGPAGADGLAGPGVPTGGSTGQLLAKKTDADHDTQWINPPSGGSGGGVGKSMAGLSVKPTSTTTVTAGEGAEIFNDLRERTYNVDAMTAGNVASGNYAHAEGEICTASGNYSHTEGRQCTASGTHSHAEGYACGAKSDSSHAEGFRCTCSTSGYYSHAEGVNCTTSGQAAHAEGKDCVASAFTSHAEGYACHANKDCSHAGGYCCTASAKAQTAIGAYNVESAVEADKLIIGKGTSTARANCFRVNDTGVFATGNYSSTGADYAELFEWLDGNPNAEDRAGRFVTLDGEKIRLAGPEDSFILGVISGNPSVIGDVHDDQWQGMYLYDIFGRPLWEDVEIPAETVEEPDPEDPEKTVTCVIIPAHMEHRQKLNPDYDGSQPYTPRTERPEWGCVGMLGKLVVIDNGDCQVNGWCKPGADGTAVPSDTPTKFRMMSRLDETHIRILIL